MTTGEFGWFMIGVLAGAVLLFCIQVWREIVAHEEEAP